jgi:hypothetical protein
MLFWIVKIDFRRKKKTSKTYMFNYRHSRMNDAFISVLAGHLERQSRSYCVQWVSQ